MLSNALVKVVDPDVVVDLTAARKPEAGLEWRRHVDFNAILMDLDIRVVHDLLGLAEVTVAGVENTLAKEEAPHLLAERSAVEDADLVALLGVESGTWTNVKTHLELFRLNFSVIHVRILGPVELVNELLSVFKERNLGELMAAEPWHPAVQDSTFTANVAAGWAAHIGECDCGREVTTVDRINTKRAANGRAALGNICMFSKTLIKVVDLNVIVDLAAGREAEAEVKSRRHVNLNTILMDLNIRIVVNVVSSAHHTRARIKNTLQSETTLHLLAKRSSINNADSIRVTSIKNFTT